MHFPNYFFHPSSLIFFNYTYHHGSTNSDSANHSTRRNFLHTSHRPPILITITCSIFTTPFQRFHTDFNKSCYESRRFFKIYHAHFQNVPRRFSISIPQNFIVCSKFLIFHQNYSLNQIVKSYFNKYSIYDKQFQILRRNEITIAVRCGKYSTTKLINYSLRLRQSIVYD